jgi:cell division protein FtsQ
MLKRVSWNAVFKCFAWMVCLGGIVTLMSFVEIKKHRVTCTNVRILIPGADNFIEREEIDAILKQNEGVLIGRNLENINLHEIEKKIVANPYIARAKVYADMDGVINIEISQRQPLLRVINAGGQDYYIDRDGLKMPVSPNFTADVLVANGHILEHFGGRVDTLITKMASDLYHTALFLKKDTLWEAQIEQIFVNDKDDIELVPRVGNQRIILGSADSLEIKMRNLLIFYKKAMPQVGWDTYKTINIKYTNQIVCEKNKPDSVMGAAGRPVAVTPSPAGASKVMDSILRAEIAAELKNNPEEGQTEKNEPEKITAAVKKVPEKKKEEIKQKAPEKKVVIITKKEPEKKAATTTKQEAEKKAPEKKAAAVTEKTPEKKAVTITKKEPEKKVTEKKEEEKKKPTATVDKHAEKPAVKPKPAGKADGDKKDTKKNK